MTTAHESLGRWNYDIRKQVKDKDIFLGDYTVTAFQITIDPNNRIAYIFALEKNPKFFKCSLYGIIITRKPTLIFPI